VTIKLDIQSPARAEQVQRLAAHAERACHAAQSLRHPIPVSLETILNGARLEG
jgi:organic hydroperoxide reductase OsmC/OhrA